MTPLERAVGEIASFLERRSIPYAIVGGVANLVRGVPRSTADVDVTIWIDDAQIPRFVESVEPTLRTLVRNPLDFVYETRVLPVRTRSGVRADLILGQLPFERDAIRRARRHRFGDRTVRVCTAEDLVLFKLVAARPRDLEDVRGILASRGGALDRDYLDPRVEEMARDLERPEIRRAYREALGASEGARPKRRRARPR